MSNFFSWIKNDKPSKSIRIVGYFIGISVILIFVFFIMGQYFTESHILLEGYATEYNSGWYIEKGKSSTPIEVKLPISTGIDGADNIVLSKTLSDTITNDEYLCLLNRWDIDIYVGDSLRYSFAEDTNDIPGGFVKSHFILVPVYPQDSGSEIRIVRNISEDDIKVEFSNIYYGNRSGIYYLLIQRFGTQFFSAFSLFIVSIMLIISGIILTIIYRRKMPVILLGFGTALAALWFIFDSFLYQVLFNNYFVDGPMEYLLIMVFPYYFIRYLNYEQNRRYERYYTFLCGFMFVNLIIMSYLHFSGINSFENDLLFTSLNVMLVGISLAFTIIRDIVTGNVKDYPLVAIGFFMIVIFGVVQVVVLNVQVDNHDALFLLFGLYMLMLFGVINMIVGLRRIEDVSQRQKHISELKSSFLANMSHEIRTPVNAILGMNEMILHESADNEIKGYSKNIKTAGDTLLDIINDILDFSKIESGKMTLVNDNYNLSDILVNLYHMISIRAMDKDLRFNIELDPAIPCSYIGDDKKLQQVLINILNNAVKYTNEGSVTFKVGISNATAVSSDEPEKVMLHFEVIDTGIGIREEDMDKLFETFERIDLKKNRSIEGTGLGLSISNNLIKLMGGTLSVKSEYSKGSVFIIDIPQNKTSDTAIGDFDTLIREKSNDEDKELKFSAPNTNIMVVDDVKMNIRVIKGLVKRHNIQVTEVLSGPDCLKKYPESNVDLILLDHMMPDMDGIETLHALKEQNESTCPIVVLTANAISGMREMYLEEGFDDYLSKPTKPVDLDKILLKYLPAEKVIYEE